MSSILKVDQIQNSSGQSAITIDTSGNLSTSNNLSVGRMALTSPIAFQANKTSMDAASGGTNINPVSFQTTNLNLTGGLSGGFSTSTYKFTAPVAGLYQFNWAIMAHRYSASYAGVYFYKNDVYYAKVQTFNYSFSSWQNFDGGVTVQLAAGDTAHIALHHDSNAQIDNSGFFSGHLIG